MTLDRRELLKGAAAAPRFTDNPDGVDESFAFDFGYIRGLLQAEAHLT